MAKPRISNDLEGRVRRRADLVITKSKAPTATRIFALLVRECFEVRVLADKCLQAISPNAELGVMFKSAVPRCKRGRSLASARDDLARARVFLTAVTNSIKPK